MDVPHTGQLLLFGGSDHNGNVFGDTWTFDGASWSSYDSSVHPSPRDDYGVAYDSRAGVVWLFGGGVAGTAGAYQPHNDLWMWTGELWEQVQDAGPMTPRAAPIMWYDQQRGRTIVAGGVLGDPRADPPDLAGDVWEWDGYSWNLISQAPPPNLYAGAGIHVGGLGADLVFNGDQDVHGYYGPPPDTHYNFGGGCGGAVAVSEKSSGLFLLGLGLLLLGRRRRRRRSLLGLLALGLVLAPSPSRAEEDPTVPKLAFMGVTHVRGVDEEEARTLASFIQLELRKQSSFDVMGTSDIEALLGLEAKRQLMGCSDDSSCLADIGGALGAGRAVYAEVSRIGSTVLLNLTMLDVGSARVAAQVGEQATIEGSLEPLVAVVPKVVLALLSKGGGLKEATPAPEELPVAHSLPYNPAPAGEIPTRADPNELSPPLPTDPGLGPLEADPTADLEGLWLALRADVEVLTGGFAPTLELGWGGDMFSAVFGLIWGAPVGVRLEARLAPWRWDGLRPFAGAGLSFFGNDAVFRGALGAEWSLGHWFWVVDGAYERTLRDKRYRPLDQVVVAVGFGRRF